MLEKQISYSHEITEYGHIQVRRITRIMEDGVELSKSYHRHVVSPGDDTEGQDALTIAIAKAVHTTEVVETYKDIIKE